jgi:hypothetical protein
MPQRDLAPGLRRLGIVPDDGIVDAELAAFGQQQDRRRGELLGDRADAELRASTAPLNRPAST